MYRIFSDVLYLYLLHHLTMISPSHVTPQAVMCSYTYMYLAYMVMIEHMHVYTIMSYKCR